MELVFQNGASYVLEHISITELLKKYLFTFGTNILNDCQKSVGFAVPKQLWANFVGNETKATTTGRKLSFYSIRNQFRLGLEEITVTSVKGSVSAELP